MALGTNDLWFCGEAPSQVVERFRTFVTQARSADPGVAIVALHTAHDEAKQAAYDALLDDAASELTTETSPVVASGTGGRLGPDDTYDGIHPSSHGEVRLAAAPPTH